MLQQAHQRSKISRDDIRDGYMSNLRQGRRQRAVRIARAESERSFAQTRQVAPHSNEIHGAYNEHYVTVTSL